MIICPNLSNPEVAKEFNEIKDAIEAVSPGKGEIAAYLIWSLNNGNGIDKAPNGAESVLFNSLLEYYNGDRNKAIVAKAKTYSNNFLKWFGNWTTEKNPYFSDILIGKASPDYDSADMNGAGAMFAIRKNGKYIGSIAINAYYRKGNKIEPWGEKGTNRVSMSSVGDAVEIEKEFRGKGYGKAAYFEFAKQMANMGYVLISAPAKFRTEASTRVWKSLVRDGYAKEVGDRYEFINSVINNVSKVVDENGEPLVVWHGGAKNITAFKLPNSNSGLIDFTTLHNIEWADYEGYNITEEQRNKYNTEGYIENATKPVGVYFAKDQVVSRSYFGARNEEDTGLYAVYLNIKNPNISNKQGKQMIDDAGTVKDLQNAIDNGNDGVVIEDIRDYGPNDEERMNFDTGEFAVDTTTDYVVFNPNQIKHVENLGTFNEENNIYHNQSDNIAEAEQESLTFHRWLPTANDRLSRLSYTTPEDEVERVKQEVADEFRRLNLKHWELNIRYDKDKYKWYVLTYRGADRKDTLDLRRIARTIGVKNKDLHVIEGNQIDKLFGYLFGQTIGENEHIRHLVNLLSAVFKNKKVNLTFVDDWYNENPAHYNHETNTIVLNINGMYNNSNGFNNIVAQTLLHELIHAATVETIKHSPELRKELESLFNKVKASAAVKQYMQQKAYGLTDIYEFLAELSNEDFVKVLQNIHTGTDKKSLFDKVLNFLQKVANTILSRINKLWKGTAYADAMEILLKASLPSEFDVKQQSEPIDDLTIFKAISARQQAAQDESQRLIIRMNVLYNQYEKMKDKTSSQQKIADRIFQTLNKLKQHRDIAAVGIALEQARLSLGQYDPTIKGPATMETANIYDFLYNAEQTNFDGVQARQLVDMYRNTIKFYSDLIAGIPSEQTIDLTQSDIDNIAQIKSLIEDHIMPLWIKAIMKVGDDIVDAQIDEEVESSYENREDMKKVAKDWLHKNMMYGDVNAVTSYLYNYSYSSNPIIKQAFHLIQHAEQLTLEEMHHIAPVLMKAYQKANKAMNSVTPGWLSIMMEFDDKGVPTGNFIRDLNYGLYQKDLNEFIENLNKRFIDHYGFTYVIDDTGSVVNSLTNEFADDEEWVNGVMPTYVEYQREIEKFKSDRAHRRFTGDYYLERLSKPYDGNIDPMSPEFTDTRFDHGLSPKTLKRYNYYQSNINYYLNKCQDPKTGYVYPERLEDADKDLLDMWMAKMDKFTNVFEADGSYKIGEDLKMAYEVRAWQRWIGSKTNRIRHQDTFNTALKEAHQRSIAEGDPKIYKDFLRFNASTGINPDFIAQTVGSLNSGKPDTDLSLRGKIMRSSLQDQVKMQLSYGRRLWEKRNDPLFWLRCKEADQYVEDAAYPRTKGNWDEDTYKKFKENFYNRELLYVDARGNYVDENGNAVSVTDPNAKALEEAGKLLTIRDWLINEYTNEAFTSGQVLGLIDESTGNPVDFSGMTVEDIRKVISEMLSYRKHKEEDDGSITEYNEPLSIFSMLTPKTDTFFNNRTGKTENTIVFLGERRFLETSSVYTNPMFNHNEGIAEKPNSSYGGGRYDNSQKYYEMRKDKDVADLYDLLIQTMSDSQSIYTTNRKFNYKLPQINAHTAALFSRILKRGYSTKALLSIWNSMSTIEENDNDMRTKQDYFIGVDGEMANDVPLKFIRNIKDPELLSTDLVSSVILFADMAHNYKNKTAIDYTLKLLRYNMDPENRKTYNKKLKPKSEPVSEDEHNKNSIKMYDSMMDVLMYGNKYGDREKGGPSKMAVSVQKTADWFLSLESSAMLGLNMFSMSVGFADSITRIFSESAAGKYMTTGDCLYALGVCLWYTPKCIWNMFNPLANNKLTALMLMNGISKGTYGTYVKADWGKGRKFISNLLMGGWSMLDWMANALLMTAFYHNIRFYDGGVVETGFYSKYDLQLAFMRAGHSKHEATLAHANYGNIGRRITLWDAYDFAPTIIENGKKVKLHGLVVINPKYELYVTQKLKTRIATKTKKRGGLYNGMNPDNDVPRWKRDVIGRLAGALRGWIVLQFQHLVSGGTDNIAREFYNEVKYETTTSGTKAKTRQKKKAFTDELRSRRMAWDYETGTPLDQILIGLWRSFRSIYKVAIQTLASKPKTAKLSEVEKYAWKDSIIFLAMLAMMMVGWTYIHDDARTVLAPQTREQAGPASMLNPFDYYDYIQDVYIPNQYWKLGVDDIYFRTVEAKISNVNPQLVLDIVSALTALKSGLDDQLGIIGIGADLINGEDNDEVLKQGAYKFYTKGDRTLYRAVGPAKNLHTALTYYGATNNLRWYTNKFGKLYRAFGYDFKQKDKDAQSKAKSNFSGGNFSGGNFSGGGFSGGNFAGGNFQ